MDTSHLRAFLKIADTGSISRAAESLGIAQPLLSQQLLRLEDEIGFKLFERTARGVTITEAGRVFQERARQILLSTEQAISDALHLKDEASGQVIFAMPASVSRLIGVPLVEALAARSPQVKVRIVEAFTGSIRGWLETGRIDLGILYDLGQLRHLSSRRLVSEELYLVGPAGTFGSADAPATVSPQAFAALPLITPGPQHGLRQLLDREAARMGVRLDIAQEIDAVDTIVGVVAHGLGYAVLPLPPVASEVAAGRLSLGRIEGGALRRSLSLVRNPSSVLTHASIRVEDLTVKIMASLINTGCWQATLAARDD